MPPSGSPATIGQFQLLEKIGEGGMGAVYKARQANLDRIVALKVLPRNLAADRQFVDRFLREARATAKLNHPHIVAGIDVGEAGGVYYFAMEYIEGENLGQRIDREKRLAEREALELGVAVASALSHAHKAGILHRDVKPENIILSSDGPKLADLGLAKGTATENTALTQTHMVVGSPNYISPEQASGARDLDGRTDVYSLGCTLYHAVAGRTPFEGATAAVLMAKHLTERMPHPQDLNPGLSDGFCAVLARMVARDREHRHAGAEACWADLEACLNGQAPLTPPLRGDLSNFLPRERKRGNRQGRDASDAAIRRVSRVSEREPRREPSRRASFGAAPYLLVPALAGLALVVGVLVGRSGGEPSAPKDGPSKPARKSEPVAAAPREPVAASKTEAAELAKVALDAIRNGPPVALPAPEPKPEVAVTGQLTRAKVRLLPAPGAKKGDWPGYRGSCGDGAQESGALAGRWPDGGLALAWSADAPLETWTEKPDGPTGPAVAGGVAVAEDRAVLLGREGGSDYVCCFDLASGRRLWSKNWNAPGSLRYSANPRATPSISAGRVFALSAFGWLACWDLESGKPLWKINLPRDLKGQIPEFGYSASPLVCDNLLIAQPGGQGTSVAAFDPATGKPVWTVRSDAAAYATPLRLEVDGEAQVLAWTSQGLAALALKDGAERWTGTWADPLSTGAPLWGDGCVFLSSPAKGGSVLDLFSARGSWTTRVRWLKDEMRTQTTSGLAWNDSFFIHAPPQHLQCVDAKSGEARWSRGGYGFQCGLIRSGDRILVLLQDGEVELIEASAEAYKPLHRFKACEPTWVHPAIAGGRLLVRDNRKVYCYTLP
ncbi:MAG: PQQ-binding-like beta-propeller repeat protein [Planctomycetota bacterium]|nr:PQQ-binding-like beta-propeller repeat protein [Planctomycetota bacterium]